MAAIPFRVRGLNVGLVVFSLLVMGGAAAVMSNPQLFKSGASNTIQNATGKLVKKGTPAFSPCKDTTLSYALIGAEVITTVNAMTSPRPSSGATPACTPLSVQSSLADPLVGQRVIATGTFTDGIFYATTLSVFATPAPGCQQRPKCLDAVPPCKIPEPIGGYCPTPKPKPSLPPQANPRAY